MIILFRSTFLLIFFSVIFASKTFLCVDLGKQGRHELILNFEDDKDDNDIVNKDEIDTDGA